MCSRVCVPEMVCHLVRRTTDELSYTYVPAEYTIFLIDFRCGFGRKITKHPAKSTKWKIEKLKYDFRAEMLRIKIRNEKINRCWSGWFAVVTEHHRHTTDLVRLKKRNQGNRNYIVPIEVFVLDARCVVEHTHESSSVWASTYSVHVCNNHYCMCMTGHRIPTYVFRTRIQIYSSERYSFIFSCQTYILKWILTYICYIATRAFEFTAWGNVNVCNESFCQCALRMPIPESAMYEFLVWQILQITHIYSFHTRITPSICKLWTQNRWGFHHIL